MSLKCKFCEKEYKSKSDYHSQRNLNLHTIRCKFNPDSIKYKCKYCNHEEETRGLIGSHVSNCKFNPKYDEILNLRIKVGKKTFGRTHSQETKDKISKARIKYLSENPDKVPYLINHSSKESYPERYFTDIFEKENINVIKDFRIGLYELDFCILDKKINIEIDGDQHYLDKRIVDSDVRRNLYLEKQGWKIIRIKWSDYQKLEDKKEFIQKLKLQL